jgi:hypothetical protein
MTRRTHRSKSSKRRHTRKYHNGGGKKKTLKQRQAGKAAKLLAQAAKIANQLEKTSLNNNMGNVIIPANKHYISRIASLRRKNSKKMGNVIIPANINYFNRLAELNNNNNNNNNNN